MVDGVLRRPPVTDYKLVDVPSWAIWAPTGRIPRGELLLRARSCSPATTTAEVSMGVLDDGFYRTGDIFAETA